MFATRRLSSGRRRFAVAALVALAVGWAATAGAASSTAEGEVGVPLMSVSVTDVGWFGEGAAAVVTGVQTCGAPVDDAATFTLSQAGPGGTVYADALVPSVTCDGRPHEWTVSLLANEGLRATWHTGEGVLTLAVPTELPLFDRYETLHVQLAPGSSPVDAAVQSVSVQPNGLALTVNYRITCPEDVTEIFAIEGRVAQRIDDTRVLVGADTFFHEECSTTPRVVPLRLDAPGALWSVTRPLVVQLGYRICPGGTDCSDVQVLSTVPATAPVAYPDVVIEPTARIAAGGSVAVVTFTARCATPRLLTANASMRQALPGEQVHDTFWFTNIGACGKKFSTYTVPVPASEDRCCGSQLAFDPLPVWRAGPALLRLRLEDPDGFEPSQYAERALTLVPDDQPPTAASGGTAPVIGIREPVLIDRAGVEGSVDVEVMCKRPTTLSLRALVTQLGPPGVGVRTIGVGGAACGKAASVARVPLIGLQSGPAWSTDRPVFALVQAVDTGPKATGEVIRVWRTTTAAVGPDPGRPAAPRNVDILSVTALADGAGALVEAAITCPAGPTQTAVNINVVQPYADTGMAFHSPDFHREDCGPTQRTITVPVFPLRSDFTSENVALTPGAAAVVRMNTSAGADARILDVGSGTVADPLVQPTAYLHAGGASLEVRLALSCADADGAEVTAHQVSAPGVDQTLIEDVQLACAADGTLAPVILAPPFRPWSSAPVLLEVVTCDGCARRLAVVSPVPASADPVPGDFARKTQVVAITRHLDGAFALARVAVTCPEPDTFFFVNVDALQAVAGESLAASGQRRVTCDTVKREYDVVLTTPPSGGRIVEATREPLAVGATFVTASSNKVGRLVASQSRTLDLAEAGSLDRAAPGAALVGVPTLLADGAVAALDVRLAACNPEHTFTGRMRMTQFGVDGRIRTGESQEIRILCTGEPQLIRYHAHAKAGLAWRSVPSLVRGEGQVCAFDLFDCQDADAAFLATVVPVDES